MRRLKLLRSKRGFTLVETSMSMVLLLILIATASGIILTGGNIFARNTLYNAAEILGNDTYRFISNRLSCADRLYSNDIKDVYGEIAATPYYEQLYIASDGSKAALTRYNVGAASEEYAFCSENRMGSFRVSVEFEPFPLNDGSYIMTMTVKIYENSISDDNVKYTKTGTFKLYNMKDDSLWLIDEMSNLDEKALYITYTYID